MNNKRQTIRRLFGLLRQLRTPYLIGMIGLSLIFAIERPFTAYIFKMLTDSILNKKLSQLWNCVIINVTFIFIWVFCVIAVTYFWRKVIIRIIADLRQTIFSHLQRLPLSFYEQRHSGDIISVITNDVGVAEQAFQQDIYNLIMSGLRGIVALTFMSILNWKLALIGIISGSLPLVINILFARPLRKIGGIIQGSLGNMSGRFADLITGYQVVRTFNLKEWILSRFSQANQELLKKSMRRVILNSSLNGAMGFGTSFNWFLPLVAGTYMVLTKEITFGVYYAYLIIISAIQMMINDLGGTIPRIQGSLAAADRIIKLLDEAPEPQSYKAVVSDSTTQPKPDLEIELSDLSFGYDDENILKSMTFGVRQGQIAALVGPSGGGKSTVFKLLLGCYPIEQGDVFVKGKSVNTYLLDELRNQFAYIPQDAYLYSGSIMENIRYGRPNASNEELIEAAKAAFAHEFISKFPDGYETKVGERGIRLSGGERQRIAIARALLKNAPILLLDEATSSLDSESEELVQRALNVLIADRTVLVIAHRLSTIEHADVIYAVDNGKIMEAGTHRELLGLNGLYSRLYELQFNDKAATL